MKRQFKLAAIRVPYSILLAILIANLGLLFYYIFFIYPSVFHSDAAAKVLLAREIVETSHYFPPDWTYANGDLFVIFGHAYIVPLLAYLDFPAGYTVHALSGLFSAVLILGGVCLLTSIINTDKFTRIALVSIFATGISGLVAENLFGQVSYGTFFYLTAFLLFFDWKFLTAVSDRKKLLFAVTLAALSTLLVWANPQRALVSYLLPLIAAGSYWRWQSDQAYKVFLTSLARDLSPLIFGVVVGFFLHKSTLNSVNNMMGAGNATWLSYDQMLVNFSYLPKQYLVIFNGLPMPGDSLTGFTGLYESVKLAVALVLPLLFVIGCRKAFLIKTSSSSFFAIFVLTSLALALFFQLTTSIPDMADPIQSSRYLLVPLLLGLIIAISQEFSFKHDLALAISRLTVISVLLAGGYSAYVSGSKSAHLFLGQTGQRHLYAQELANFLSDNDLKYGYATFWNAGVLSVLSEEEVLVRQISFRDGLPIPMRHLSSDRWYRPASWEGKTFLLVHNREHLSFNVDKLAQFQGLPDSQLSFKDYQIYVYSGNIASGTPHWDSDVVEPIILAASEHTYHTIGRLAKGGVDQKQSIRAQKGQTGALHYGPYMYVAPGDYEIKYQVFARHNPRPVARIDVTSSGGVIEAYKMLNVAEGDESLHLHLDEGKVLEFRVWSLGEEEVIFEQIEIVRVAVHP